MKSFKKRNFALFLGAVTLSAVLLSGCVSAEEEARRKAEQEMALEMERTFEARKNPSFFIETARSFALEELHAPSDAELNFIKEQTPEIIRKSDGNFVIFYWKMPNADKNIQVLSSAPPLCTMIAVQRVKRVMFP